MAWACALALGAGCATGGAAARDTQVEELRSRVDALKARQEKQDQEIAELKHRLEASSSATSVGNAPLPPGASAQPLAATPAPLARESRADPASQSLVPGDLKVVYLAPEPVEYSDATEGHADHTPNSARVLPPRHRPPASPSAAPTPADPNALEAPSLKEEVAPASAASSTADSEYAMAMAAGDPHALERFSRNHPTDPRADNALFEAGLQSEKAGKADQAAREFTEVVQQHPAGDVVADAMLHLAACDLVLQREEEARATLKRLSTEFPGTAQAQAAGQRLADLKAATP